MNVLKLSFQIILLILNINIMNYHFLYKLSHLNSNVTKLKSKKNS